MVKTVINLNIYIYIYIMDLSKEHFTDNELLNELIRRMEKMTWVEKTELYHKIEDVVKELK